MLFDFAYFLKNFDADFFNGEKFKTINFIIPIDDKIIGKKPEIFQTLHSSKNRFCFYIPAKIAQCGKDFIKEEIILNLVRLFFLPNYMRINGKYILFIEKATEEQKSLQQLHNDFCNELKKQAIIVAMIEMLPADSSLEEFSGDQYISMIHPDLNRYLSNGEHQSSFEVLAKSFTLSSHLNEKWIVPVSNLEDFKDKVKQIENFEQWMTIAKPMKVKLIIMYNDANQNNERLKSENDLLKFKLEDSIKYLQLTMKESQGFQNEITNLRLEIQHFTGQPVAPESRFFIPQPNYADNRDYIEELQKQITLEQNRAHAILEWYKKEYELLPMWYKKFGQIIKVLIGKRTFKSLFK